MALFEVLPANAERAAMALAEVPPARADRARAVAARERAAGGAAIAPTCRVADGRSRWLTMALFEVPFARAGRAVAAKARLAAGVQGLRGGGVIALRVGCLQLYR